MRLSLPGSDPPVSMMRLTYLPMRSASTLTGSPGSRAKKPVCSQVWGMMATSQRASPRRAFTVRLTPLRAMEPCGMVAAKTSAALPTRGTAFRPRFVFPRNSRQPVHESLHQVSVERRPLHGVPGDTPRRRRPAHGALHCGRAHLYGKGAAVEATNGQASPIHGDGLPRDQLSGKGGGDRKGAAALLLGNRHDLADALDDPGEHGC